MLAIIPARGGSKGLPGKNIKMLDGKPLIAHTIEAAVNSKAISKVIVSTDSEEIAKVAKNYGAEVPFMRPSYLAGDDAKSIDVYQYTIQRMEKEQQSVINEIVVLQPTSPLRTAQHIDDAAHLFNLNQADSVISYCKEEHPIFWHKFITEDGKFEDIFQEDYLKNRQEIRSTYYPNGAIYIFKKELLFNNKYYTENSFSYIMPRQSSIDIDTIDDFKMCEIFMKENKSSNN
ncbi:acylneuraminate cytidylyltransferase family protein [Tamlana sp. 2_MG-2023]|uniref:acylneuraminate cytidylyltransferase family protein n=1 Tax=unclassified Tamlana TaxID=2614803 RepID=UPI0026E1CF59|nr:MULTISPECIES: acylneuraminate cytidylyltransferase family protein [unclassified Tamlana]MDO6759747.1 acylneuraminate cytidylyltransferase family protein [Tamlana sp. 2_MG-2023]MDO6791370.1 acylneuraminate cytidylyltransferase family protein [Tamlana sp. 1_MG-2023]